MTELTPEERKAVHDLARLANRWPKSLKLFSWSGALHVLKPGKGRTFRDADVEVIGGIPNDGGDPSLDDLA